MKETRNIQRDFDLQDRKLGGYAVVFDSESRDMGGFIEVIDRNALEGVLEQSDVKCYYNHDENRGILARSRRGKGSLTLRVDDTGLYYEFEAPHTPLGDEVLEGVRRQDITGSSFAFTIAEDRWEKREDGKYTRTILKFKKIFDVSPVIDPAYPEASVALRKMKELSHSELRKQIKLFNIRMLNRSNEEIEAKIAELEAMLENETDEEIKAEIEQEIAELKSELESREKPEEEPENEPEAEPEPEPEPDDEKEDKLASLREAFKKFREADSTKLETQDKIDQLEKQQEDEPDEEVKEEIQNQIDELKAQLDERKNKTNKSITKRNMFSLIQTINDVVNNRSLNEASQAVVNEGVKSMRKAGLNYTGQIQLPVVETRDEPAAPAAPTAPAAVVATVATYGKEAVAEDRFNILAPLYDRMVLKEAGATFLTGLVGNVAIPKYSGSNVGWKGEIAAADDGKGTFSEVTFAPKRLTAYIDISKQFLNQDSVQAEAMLKADIVNALADKLEATILGNANVSETAPGGIFYNAGTQAVTYANLVENEATLETAKIFGPKTYIVNPAVKAAMKTTTVGGTKSDIRMILENGEANGYKVLCTGNAKGYALADWSELVVAQWGAIDLVVDPYTQAANGAIRLVVNAYFDAGFRRNEAVVAKTLPTA